MNLITENYQTPTTKYCKTKEIFDQAVGEDFILHANKITSRGKKFLVGLAHGQSPAGAYQYILDHYGEINKSSLLRFTFVNSPLQSQRNLDSSIIDAGSFLKKMLRLGLINKDQILGRSLNRENIEEYAIGFNQKLHEYLEEEKKTGLDYIFLAADPTGRVAGIARDSTAFDSTEKVILVNDLGEPEVTGTPHFILQSRRIAFLATKANKRRPLAWLYSRWGRPDQSPSFLRFGDNIRQKMMVFIDDTALTWPQITLQRKTPYGSTYIRLDLAEELDESRRTKRPVILFIHGFLGLNSFDSLLTAVPEKKYISAAMHYGSIPHDLPLEEYSKHVALNIDFVVQHFGEKGHPVYIFDHSMSNIYFMILERDFDQMNGVKKYLRGRIGANPFFGEEAKHAMTGFLDNVVLPAIKFSKEPRDVMIAMALRRVIPFDTKKGVRKRGINFLKFLIKKDSSARNILWDAVKERIVTLMTNMDSLPEVNKIPIARALTRLPAKVFAIQVQSALEESYTLDTVTDYRNMEHHHIPILILQSRKDVVAKYVDRMHKGKNITVIDVTNEKERKDLFREHLFHMIFPLETVEYIERFIQKTERNYKARMKQEKSKS